MCSIQLAPVMARSNSPIEWYLSLRQCAISKKKCWCNSAAGDFKWVKLENSVANSDNENNPEAWDPFINMV